MEIAIVVLGLLVLAQLVERYLYTKKMTDELSKSQKAVMSRNINEYLSAITTEKKDDTDFIEDDEVEVNELSDDDFSKFIKKDTK